MSDQPAQDTASWGFAFRVVIKAIALFGSCNLIFALIYPMEFIGGLSLYNVVFPGRERLPHAADPATWYSVTTAHIPAMMASHRVAQGTADDELRVFLLGDSATWGWLLEPDETLAAALNELDLQHGDQSVVFYNLAYPEPSTLKDVLLLDDAMRYQPDAVIWLLSPTSLAYDAQYRPPMVQANAHRVARLVGVSGQNAQVADEGAASETLVDRTLIGQRDALANLLRLQGYGVAWTATGIDQAIPDRYNRVSNDLQADASWERHETETTLTEADFAFDVLALGEHISDGPLLLVNQPMFVADGTHSDVRYNANYPIWAYDQYRAIFAQVAAEAAWYYVDLWDALPPEEFTNTPLHYSSQGARMLAAALREPFIEMMRAGE